MNLTTDDMIGVLGINCRRRGLQSAILLVIVYYLLVEVCFPFSALTPLDDAVCLLDLTGLITLGRSPLGAGPGSLV